MKRYLLQTKCKNKRCPAWDNCNQLPAEVHESNGKVDTLFIAEAAGNKENKKGYPFAGGSGFTVRSIINDINKNDKGYAFDNMVRFWPRDENGETRAPHANEMKHCSVHLLRNIEKIKPKKICFIGNTSFRFFHPTNNALVQERGIIQKVRIGNKDFKSLATYHPASALWSGSPDLLGIIKLDFDRILNNHIVKIKKDFKVKSILTMNHAEKLFKLLKHGDFTHLAFDLEADNLNIKYDNRPLSIGLSNGRKNWAIPLYHPETPFTPDEIKWIFKQLRWIAMHNCGYKWIAHNAKFDRLLLHSFANIPYFKSPVLDTMAFAFLLDENRRALPTRSLSLKYLAKNEFQYKGYRNQEVLRARNEGRLAEIGLKDHLYYVGEDSYVTRKMFTGLRKMARWQNYEQQALTLLEYFYDGLFELFVAMESNGIFIDKYQLRDLKSKNRSVVLKQMKGIEAKFKDSKATEKVNRWLIRKSGAAGMTPLFGDPWHFNINKDKHKRRLFFNVLDLDPVNEGETGPRMDKDFQEEYKDKVDEVKWYSEYNALKKLKSSYIDAIWNYLPPDGEDDCQDGFIRPKFSGVGTKTGRGKARDPNSMQIPRGDTPEQVEIRKMYRVRPGYVLLYCDVMTAEVRVWGQSSGDKVLCNIFKKGQKYRNQYRKNPTKKLKEQASLQGDFHTMTASVAYEVKPKVAKKKYRQGAKNISLGKMYARSNKSIAAQIGKTEKEVDEIEQKIFGVYKEGNKWFTDQEKLAADKGYVESQMGRRRRLYAFYTDVFHLLNEAKRQARNSPIQGYSSDIAFLGGALINRYIIKGALDWAIRNTVHDSVMTEVPLKDLKKAIKVIEDVFLVKVPAYLKKYFGIKIIVPIEVDFEFGTNLGNLRKWDFSIPEFKKHKKWLRKLIRKEKEKFRE